MDPTPFHPHILFVDDEAPIRELLSLYFRKKGLHVTTAITGAEAKQLSLLGSYDLVILDLHLADEDGLDLLDHFKDNCPDLPVIIFTGMGSDLDLVARVRAAGADAFMSKTESLGVLLAQVQQVLARRPGAAGACTPAAATGKPERPPRALPHSFPPAP